MKKEIVRNYARRLHKRFSLTLPVDLEFIAKKYSKLIYMHIPYNIDGASISLKSQDTKILVNSDYHPNRQRFTLAHEIGHVLIPWHVGTIFDNTNINDGNSIDDYWTIEDEANIFASELLMPTDWILSLIESKNDISEVHKEIYIKAEVSPLAACFKLKSLLPIGYIFIIKDLSGLIKYTGKSKHTMTKLPEINTNINIEEQFSFSDNIFTFYTDNEQYFWIKVPNKISLVEYEECNWRDTLNIIVEDLNIDKTTFIPRLNGVLGFANGYIKKSDSFNKEELFSLCLQRFANRDGFEAFTVHELFSRFLSFKINDLYNKQR